MSTAQPRRSITIRREGPGRYVAVNERGGEVAFGMADAGDGTAFTPVELLLAAIGGCSGIDVDILTSRRAEPESFTIDVDAASERGADGNRLTDVEVTFRLIFPPGEAGDAAREVLPAAITRSHDRLCTVSRTVELGTPVSMRAARDA